MPRMMKILQLCVVKNDQLLAMRNVIINLNRIVDVKVEYA